MIDIQTETEAVTFESLGLSEPVLKAIAETGYTQATPIQAKAIPIVLRSQDVVGIAQTGTGKTASFTLPMIEILAGGRARVRMPRSLVLEPTRELAAQVAENFDKYGKHVTLSKALLVGGESMADQLKILERGVDVLIATPGRLLDLFERGKILLSDIKILVIDEADRMLDMGFIPDIERIISLIPTTRQTLLFSATMAPEIRKLSDKFLQHPREISVSAAASTAITVDQKMVKTTTRNKNALLQALIKQENVKSAFIFCNRKRDVATLAKFLKDKGFSAGGLHGDMVQAKRNEMLADFKNGTVSLLVCSDVAARGLDVQDVSHVFNYDVPIHADDYVHRIGRTGRAGKSGATWMFVTDTDDKFLAAIVARIQREIPCVTVSGAGSSSTDAPSAGKSERSAPRTSSSSSSSKRPERPSSDRPSRSPEPTVVESRERRPAQTDRRPLQAMEKRDVTRPRYRDDVPDSDVVGFGTDLPGFMRK
ncbi:MAG: DEAD/DEAH box helicase [Pseudomonadota bacterium]